MSKKALALAEEENTVSLIKPVYLYDPTRDLALRAKENFKSIEVPFFITVMGKNGKLLLNVCIDQRDKKDVKLFFNTGKYDDGLQIVRSCLRNMLSFDFKNIVALNAYRGFYLAVQTSHDNSSIRGYNTDPKYKNRIGLLDYVDIDDIQEFAYNCNSHITPKLSQYCEEVRNYIRTCKEIAQACK